MVLDGIEMAKTFYTKKIGIENSWFKAFKLTFILWVLLIRLSMKMIQFTSVIQSRTHIQTWIEILIDGSNSKKIKDKFSSLEIYFARL